MFNAPGRAGSTENFVIPQWHRLSGSQGIRVLVPSRRPENSSAHSGLPGRALGGPQAAHLRLCVRFCLRCPWVGPAPAAVGCWENRLLRPAEHPCSLLSQRPTPGSHFAGESCGPVLQVVFFQWVTGMCVCTRAKANIKMFGECFRKIARSRLPRFAYMFLFLSFLLCTCVISILERFGFSYLLIDIQDMC